MLTSHSRFLNLSYEILPALNHTLTWLHESRGIQSFHLHITHDDFGRRLIFYLLGFHNTAVAPLGFNQHSKNHSGALFWRERYIVCCQLLVPFWLKYGSLVRLNQSRVLWERERRAAGGAIGRSTGERGTYENRTRTYG